MLKVYAHPASQPARSVIWACVMKQVPIQLYTESKYLLDVNPRRQMPVIDDNGFILDEMPAILAYLADKFGWDDLYPDNLQIRGRINAYLHAHHSMTRLATMKLMAPHIHVAFGGAQLGGPYSYIFNQCLTASMESSDPLSEGQKVVETVIDYIEEVLLTGQSFIGATEQASIADIACYDEIGQLETANLVDFSSRKNVSRWMEKMRDLPFHDPLHSYNSELGDIRTRPNTMERFSAAIETAMQELGALKGVSLV
ncbi:MAG: glutathione S-transferase family protein [Sneathiellales bacterium]|nr:glutathione S-transferase family protein [Sneathiellales bacterium]